VSGGAASTPEEEPAPDHRAGFVALVGRSNVGKSTILNALVGEKVAIISSRPQTTRRRILGIVTTEHAQAILVDTPGIHQAGTAFGRQMVSVARRAMPDSDVVCWVVDVSAEPDDQDRRIAGQVRAAGHPVVVALNKSDLLPPQRVLSQTEVYASLAGSDSWVLTIATRGHNLGLLWDLIVDALPPGPALYPADQLTDQTDRMLVAELVREAALRLLRQEVPHGIEVVVTDFQTRHNGTVHIAADMYVERQAHKAIVIGSGGRTVKAIGTSARRSIERLLETRVFLELVVKVRTGWRKDPSELRRLGY
jgi:GTP-binding protein Era